MFDDSDRDLRVDENGTVGAPEAGESGLAPDETVAAGERAGAEIGSYRLLQVIGEGGMGEVWLAQQERPVSRRVALKVVKAGMNSREVMARFQSERQALALMDHPAIARVFDAGSTAEGRPYFVMEYVAGVPITTYCDQHKLTTRERLELFVHVCEGVQHAHQKAIIHRDLKPSNILVTEVDGKPVPKIIDFGVAKAIAQRLTAETMFTRIGVLIGTPQYMSPEQAGSGGLDIDTRTDVYSLGVILYELLVGAPPLEFRTLQGAAFHEMLRKVRDEDAVRPSTKLRTLGGDSNQIAERRHTDPGTLARQLSGDLDCITLKALEKDRVRRYSSPADLAADIGHYLNDEPVSATSPSTLYRLRKFARRHRTSVAAGAAVALSLIVLAIVMTVQTIRIAKERDRANHEAETARRVSDFLQGLFQQADPYRTKGKQVTAQDLLDAGAKQVSTQLQGQPMIQSRLMAIMGQSYLYLEFNERARKLLQKSARISSGVLGPNSPETLSATDSMVEAGMHIVPLKESDALARQMLARARQAFGNSVQVVPYMTRMMSVLAAEERYKDEEHLAREALAICDRTGQSGTIAATQPEIELGEALMMEDKASEAERYLRRGYDALVRQDGVDSRRALTAQGFLAMCLVLGGRIPEAMAVFRDSIIRCVRLVGAGNSYTVNGEIDMASALEQVKQYDEAQAVLEAAIQAIPGKPVTKADLEINLAELSLQRGRPELALAQLKQAVDDGYRRPDSLRTNSVWNAFRRDPRFESLVAGAQRNSDSAPK